MLTNNSQIRALAQQIYALTDDPQIHQWAQSIYDSSPDPVPTPSPIPPPAVVPSLILFEHDDYGGRSISMEGAHANLANVFQDIASSAIVVGAWEVFSDANFSGRRVALEDGRYPSLRKLSMNDAISSCRPLVPPIDDTKPERKRRLAELELGFFWSDEGQMAQTAGWVTFTHIPTIIMEWKDESFGFQLLRAARAAGHTRFVIGLGEFAFAKQGRNRVYIGPALLRSNLRTFMGYLKGGTYGNFADSTIAWLAPDEPNLNDANTAPIAEGALDNYIDDVDAVSRDLLGKTLPQWCIYAGGNGYRPCLARFAKVCVDDYGKGLGVVADSEAMNRPHLLIPQVVTMDGRGPEWPDPWIEAAINSPQCGGIFAFDYVGAEGRYPGLRDAGQDVRDAWVNAGREIVAARNG